MAVGGRRRSVRWLDAERHGGVCDRGLGCHNHRDASNHPFPPRRFGYNDDEGWKSETKSTGKSVAMPNGTFRRRRTRRSERHENQAKEERWVKGLAQHMMKREYLRNR